MILDVDWKYRLGFLGSSRDLYAVDIDLSTLTALKDLARWHFLKSDVLGLQMTSELMRAQQVFGGK